MRGILRDATAGHHAAVDRRFMSLLAGGISGYLEFLRASAAAIIPLERALTAAGAGRILPLWNARTREAALRFDLAALGAAPGPDHRPPDVGGEAHQFGMLYVLEGSRLGGKILARNAQAHADPRIRTATRYLRHGESERFWQTFLSALEASEVTRYAPADAIAGARTAFALFAAEPAPRRTGAAIPAEI